MPDGKLSDVLQRMRTLAQVRALRGQGDGALVERFVNNNDEAAFELLVERHGPMVLGVCRRILADGHDAEDAFQAVFLLLARRASTIRKPNAIGAWLHAVARQVACRARKGRDRRNRLQVLTACEAGPAAPDEQTVRVEWRELRPVLDEELGRLPEKYRAPVVLCYLEERSNTEAAEQLGWPVGTVKGRLAQARSLLQTRLARRGLALSAGLILTETVSPALEASTVEQAARIASGATPAAAGVSPTIEGLYYGGLRALKLAKIKVIVAVLAFVSICAVSGAYAYSALAERASLPKNDAAPIAEDNGKPADVGDRAKPLGVSLEARLVGAKGAYKLDLGGQSAEDFRKQIEMSGQIARRPGLGGSRFPASPSVGLKLEATNTGKEEIKVQVGSDTNTLTLDLKGPGVFFAPLAVRTVQPVRRTPEVVTIAPGQTVTLVEVPTLALPKPGTGSQAYWTEPGDYELTVEYSVGVSPAPAQAPDFGDGFGLVKVRSVPIVLKVVEMK
jgi:RNA polymerase sigma factor (sigma-70 family)